MNVRLLAVTPVLAMVALVACGDGSADLAALREANTSRVTTDLTFFKDADGRYLYWHGVNLGGDTKVPCRFSLPDGTTLDCNRDEFNPNKVPITVPISYVGKPFAVEDADRWFGELARRGFNSVRFVLLWDAIEHEGPGKFDAEYIAFVKALTQKAREWGIYVLLDMHQDLFTRYLHVNYTSVPEMGEPGSIEWMLLSLLPHDKDGKVCSTLGLDCGYDDRVGGDGAPRWAIQASLPEKKMDSPHWGRPRLVSGWDVGFVCTAYRLYQEFSGVEEEDKLSVAECQVLEAKQDQACAYLLDPEGQAATVPQVLKDSLDDVLAATLDEGTKWLAPLLRYICEAPGTTAFPLVESADYIPLNDWWNNSLLSGDMERCMAAFFAGESVWPSWKVDPATGATLPPPAEGEEDARDGVSIQDFLQDHYIQSFVKVAEAVKDEPNVIGYDLMNEPPATFVMMTVLAAYFQLGGKAAEPPDPSEVPEGYSNTYLEDLVLSLFQADKAMGHRVYRLITALGLLPPDTSPETKKAWGYEGLDAMALINLNFSFDWSCLQPFYQRLGSRLQDTDPNAILWIENTGGGASGALGVSFGDSWMERLQYMKPGSDEWEDEYLKQQVHAPHWYPDIYPYFGLNEMPRDFRPEEWEFEEFLAGLGETMVSQKATMGNPPVVFGEFGTYFNYNLNYSLLREQKAKGATPAEVDAAIRDFLVEQAYPVSEQILDNYYEAYEALFAPRILWCFSAHNTFRYGDLWNREDFSIVDQEGTFRGDRAWSRPYPRAMSGKPVAMHFWSPLHYFVPEKGRVNPLGEFVLEMASKETEAPTEIFVPEVQYPDGFYVWLSDGTALFDWERRVLYWYPTLDQPGTTHQVRLLPPLPGESQHGWTYFFKDGMVVDGDRSTL